MDITHISLHWRTLLLLVAGGTAIAAAASALGARFSATAALMQWARGTGAQALAAVVLLGPTALVNEATLVIGGVLVIYGLALQATAIAAFVGRNASGWIIGGSVASATVAFAGLAARSPATLHDLATSSELLLALFAHAVGGSFLFFGFVMRRVRGVATRDALTGALNRVGFFEAAEAELSRACRHGTGIATLALDIDKFKTVNDRLGHPAGDKLLAALSETMRRVLRKEDVLARFGGDEFVVLLPATTETVAVDLADRLRRTVADASHRIAGRVVEMSVSIGVFATTGPAAPSLEVMLERADEALRRAKQEGRNRVRVVGPRVPHGRTRNASARLAGPGHVQIREGVPG